MFVLGVLVVKLQSHHGGRSKETTAPNQPMIQSSIIFAKQGTQAYIAPLFNSAQSAQVGCLQMSSMEVGIVMLLQTQHRVRSYMPKSNLHNLQKLCWLHAYIRRFSEVCTKRLAKLSSTYYTKEQICSNMKNSLEYILYNMYTHMYSNFSSHIVQQTFRLSW